MGYMYKLMYQRVARTSTINIYKLLETSEHAIESVETPMEIPVELGQGPSSKFQSICPNKMNVRTQVVPKTSCTSSRLGTCICRSRSLEMKA